MSLTSSTSSFALSMCIGKRDKKSAFACLVVERYSILVRGEHIGTRRAVMPIFVIVRLLELEYRSSVPAMWLTVCGP